MKITVQIDETLLDQAQHITRVFDPDRLLGEALRPLVRWKSAQRLAALGETELQLDKLDLSERFVDATFVSAKRGALPSAKPSGAKVRSSWQGRRRWCSDRRPRSAC